MGDLMITNLMNIMEDAVDRLYSQSSSEVFLFHHNDTDGLSSGTILLSTFKKIGFRVTRLSLEKPYPQVLEQILSGKNQIIVFADFAGKIAPIISNLNKRRNLVIILDHHPAEAVIDDMVLNLDGELFGLKGDRDISASSTCFLFARTLLKRYGFSADCYSHLGVLGAVGDGFLVDGKLSGFNRSVLKTAVEQKSIRIEKNTDGEEYYIVLGGSEYPAGFICNVLDTLGGVGYYSKGTSKGIDVCQKGLDAETSAYVHDLIQKKELIFEEEIRNLKKNLHTTDHLQWFNVEDRFEPMGVKMIGVFCTLIKDRELLDKTKYLAGFQNVPNTVPGFGDIDFNAAKISMRTSEYLTEGIRAGRIPGLNSFLPEATNRLGGFSDACHSLSAATTVGKGQNQILIDEIEKILGERMDLI